MTIGWGIISTGRHPDSKMAPAINAASDASLVAVLSRNKARAEAFASKHGATSAYTNIDELLTNSSVDVVYIASPNALHAEQAIAAASRGKHVLVEKPMALSPQDCEAMIDACNQFGVLLGVGFHLRHHPGHKRLGEMLAQGVLGTIAFAEANWGRGSRGQTKPPPRTELQAWWDDPSLVGAGAFMATGVHCVDTLRHVLRKEVETISAMTDSTESAPLEELLALNMTFEGGILGRVMTGRRTPDYTHNDVTIYGSLGSACVRGSIDMAYGGTLEVATSDVTVSEKYGPDPIELYKNQVEAYCMAVSSGAALPASGFDGLKAAEITQGMLRSKETGRTVKI